MVKSIVEAVGTYASPPMIVTEAILQHLSHELRHLGMSFRMAGEIIVASDNRTGVKHHIRVSGAEVYASISRATLSINHPDFLDQLTQMIVRDRASHDPSRRGCDGR